MSRASQLDKQIGVLISDSVALLKARMSELGIHASNTVDLLAKAKEIVGRHKELQSKASKLQAEVREPALPDSCRIICLLLVASPTTWAWPVTSLVLSQPCYFSMNASGNLICSIFHVHLSHRASKSLWTRPILPTVLTDVLN